MSDIGWVKLHRELMNKAIWSESTAEQKVILITLLMMANHKEKEWEWQGKKYVARPGQFVTSLASIVKNSGIGVSVRNVRTALVRFENYGFLTNQSTNKNRLITIVNWEKYQSRDGDTDKATDKQLTSNRQATDKQLTTNKNDKNDKNDKNERIKNIKEQTPLTDMINSYTANPILAGTLNDFAEMRKEIKYPLTEKALKLILNKLDRIAKSDDEKIKILEESIMNRYRGVFELKKGVSRGSNKGHSSKDEDDGKYDHLINTFDNLQM